MKLIRWASVIVRGQGGRQGQGAPEMGWIVRGGLLEVAMVWAETWMMRRSGLLPKLLQMWERMIQAERAAGVKGPHEECLWCTHVVSLRTQRSGWLDHSDPGESRAMALTSGGTDVGKPSPEHREEGGLGGVNKDLNSSCGGNRWDTLQGWGGMHRTDWGWSGGRGPGGRWGLRSGDGRVVRFTKVGAPGGEETGWEKRGWGVALSSLTPRSLTGGVSL